MLMMTRAAVVVVKRGDGIGGGTRKVCSAATNYSTVVRMSESYYAAYTPTTVLRLRDERREVENRCESVDDGLGWSSNGCEALNGCFQSYLYRRARATSPMCLQCRGGEDTVEHTLFECYHWKALSDLLSSQLGHRPCTANIQDIICGSPFDQLPADSYEKSSILRNAEESFRLFYG
ncbi:hypothetical protein ACI65C_000131 [Semiaphis heraclei]